MIKKKTTLKKYDKSDSIYITNHSLYKYHDIKQFESLSLESKHSFIAIFSNDLDKFCKAKAQKETQRRNNKCV